MKTKALALVAAVFAAGTITSMAQVYSANAVGYVNLTLPAGFSMISNPLDNGDNDLNTILPNLGPEATGTLVYRFDAATQNYADSIAFIFGAGWLGADMVIAPGEGFFIQNNSGADLSITFVGDVPQGNLDNPIAGQNRFSIKSSQVPQEARLGHAADLTGPKSGLEFPGATGDTVYQWDAGIQNYKDSVQYIEGAGWLGGDGDPDGPVIGVGEGFFVQKVNPVDSVPWTRQFSVN